MSAVDENIVREYFEQNRFLVRQVRKYEVHSRKKTSEEEIDLLVLNPAYAPTERKPDFLLFASELRYIHRALVVVKGWHTARFTPTMLKSSPHLFQFLEKTVLKRVEEWLPSDPKELAQQGPVMKILVLPGLPTAEPFRTQSVELMKEKGIDGIISFRAMLLDIIERVEVNRIYQKSEILEVIRVLKKYDLLNTPQMELFEKPRAREAR